MKIFFSTLQFLTITLLCLSVTHTSAQRQDNYDLNNGNGKGFRFWNGDNSYKIHMGNTNEYKFGPVQDYSIKMNMEHSDKRGFTWGRPGKTPIAGLNLLGHFEIAGDFTSKNSNINGGNLYLNAPVGSGNGPNFYTHGIYFRNANTTSFGLSYGDYPNYGSGTLNIGNVSAFGTYDTDKPVIRMGLRETTINGKVIMRGETVFTKKSNFTQVAIFNSNVGIGTSEPKNKLSVNGHIWAKEIKVKLTDGADWVFEEDYDLKPLEEVEAFIKTYKHLPEIPSADDFRANDMKVSEMTNKLLQKIEELTLYTIAQEKLLQLQMEKNKALEARLAKLELLLKK